jgi:stearoyl-CoA desaturase (delta-9 desaturase)
MRDGFHWGQVILGVVLYIVTGISITAGYHRLFAHKAYDAHFLVKLFFLIFGAATFQNSVLKWASDHRLHHTKVDSEEDPYSIQEGFFYAHMGWVFLKKNCEIKDRYAKDFLSDKLILWQHKYYLLISVIAGLVLPAVLGQVFCNSWLGGLAIGGFVRVVFVHHCTFFINSLCHYLGTTPYTDSNSAKDSWYMALLTFGEGYHNFHHFFQTDYRNGIYWYQFDPTKWLINFLRSFGLAYKLKLTPQDKILAARMQMKIKALKLRMAQDLKFQEEVEALKTRVLEALKNFQELQRQYKFNKAQEIKAKMKLAQQEFNATLEAWNLYLTYLNSIPVKA